MIKQLPRNMVHGKSSLELKAIATDRKFTNYFNFTVGSYLPISGSRVFRRGSAESAPGSLHIACKAALTTGDVESLAFTGNWVRSIGYVREQ